MNYKLVTRLLGRLLLLEAALMLLPVLVALIYSENCIWVLFFYAFMKHLDLKT